ncbi:hypothetical protein Bca4012_039691 [Brassica carinata]
MAVKKAVQNGNVEDAIENVNDLNPEVHSLLDRLPRLLSAAVSARKGSSFDQWIVIGAHYDKKTLAF